MKFFIAFAAFVAVALSANHHKPGGAQEAQLEAIIAAINSPSTDPATAALLEAQLQQIIAAIVKPEPIAVGPTLVEGLEPISVGPALVDEFEPIHVGPALVDEFEPIHVGPTLVDDDIIIAPASPIVSGASSSPLVQIIVNVAQAEQAPGVVGSPVQNPTFPETVNIVDQAPEVVNVVEQAPEAINVVDLAPETVNVVQPIIPAPAVTLPESLN